MSGRELATVVMFSLFAGSVVGFALANMGPCQTTNSQCARDWLSATSGWAAVIAAGLTVYFINKQLREGSRQHLEQMKFQAFEKLTIAQQVGQAANSAFGTVTQIFHELENSRPPRSQERLRSEINAARFALDILKSAQMPEKRVLIQGNIPPEPARADVALAKFIEIGSMGLELTTEQFDGDLGRGTVRASSGHLVLAHTDLQQLSDEMRSFQKRWRHLSV